MNEACLTTIKNLNRRDFIKAMGLCAAGLTLPGCTDAPRLLAGKTSAGKPNIVFIMVDDMGWADLGCYGSQHIKTPNIDKMADEGMRFTQAYSGCTVCAPARSVLMTGLHTGHTPVRGNTGGIPMRHEDVTIAELLKQAVTPPAGSANGAWVMWERLACRRNRVSMSSSAITTRYMLTTTGRITCGITAKKCR